MTQAQMSLGPTNLDLELGPICLTGIGPWIAHTLHLGQHLAGPQDQPVGPTRLHIMVFYRTFEQRNWSYEFS